MDTRMVTSGLPALGDGGNGFCSYTIFPLIICNLYVRVTISCSVSDNFNLTLNTINTQA